MNVLAAQVHEHFIPDAQRHTGTHFHGILKSAKKKPVRGRMLADVGQATVSTRAGEE